MEIIVGTLVTVMIIGISRICSNLEAISHYLKEIDRKLSKEYKS